MKYKLRRQKALLEHKDFLTSIIREEWNRILEHEKKVSEKYAPEVMTKIVFALVNTGGILTVVSSGENSLNVMGRIFGEHCVFEKISFEKAIRYLGRKKYVQVTARLGGWTLHLTEKGMERILTIAYDTLHLRKMNPWDGVWRVVFFDIPNIRKWARDGFRKKLKELNFLKLQKSVFVTPYPCKEEVKFLASFYEVSNCVRLIETNFLGGDAEIKRRIAV